jgi:hypothetical protein
MKIVVFIKKEGKFPHFTFLTHFLPAGVERSGTPVRYRKMLSDV